MRYSQKQAHDYKVDPDMAAWVWGGQLRKNSQAQILRAKLASTARAGPSWDGPYYGIDWGFSQDPTAAVRAWVYNGALYVSTEAYGVDVDIDIDS